METGDESDGQEALLIHLPPQEEVTLQVVQAEVVLTRWGRATRKHMVSIIQNILTNQLLFNDFSLLLTLTKGTKTQVRENEDKFNIQ